MSEKFYTTKEMMEAARKRLIELCQEADLKKAVNTSHEIELGSEPNNDEAECPESLLAGEVCKPDNGSNDKKSKKKKAFGDSEEEGEESESEESEEESSEEPAHEQDMSFEEDKEHDAKENQEDEQDADNIEADEEPETKEADKKDKKDKKENPFQKSEKKLQDFMAKMEMKKARIDEGKSIDQKQKARIERNSRVKFAVGSPTGTYEGKDVRPRKKGEGDKVFGKPKKPIKKSFADNWGGAAQASSGFGSMLAGSPKPKEGSSATPAPTPTPSPTPVAKKAKMEKILDIKKKR